MFQAFLIVIALLVMNTAARAETASLKGRVYLSPFYGQYTLEEGAGSDTLGGLRGGAFLSDHFIIEGWLARLNDHTVTPAGGRGGWYLHRVDALYLPWEPMKHNKAYMARPFLAAGVGGIRLNLDAGNEFGFATDFGMGIDFLLPQFQGVYPMVRSDVRYLIRSLRGEILTGMELTTGMSFQWKPVKKQPQKMVSPAPIKIKTVKPPEIAPTVDMAPQTLAVPEITPEVTTLPERVDDVGLGAFGLNSAIISDDQKKALDDLVHVLRHHPEAMLELTGHTDNVGTESFNLDLSHKRALAVRDYLKAKGISPLRMVLVDAGELKPKESNLTEEGRTKNRRVIVRVIYP